MKVEVVNMNIWSQRTWTHFFTDHFPMHSICSYVHIKLTSKLYLTKNRKKKPFLCWKYTWSTCKTHRYVNGTVIFAQTVSTCFHVFPNVLANCLLSAHIGQLLTKVKIVKGYPVQLLWRQIHVPCKNVNC